MRRVSKTPDDIIVQNLVKLVDVAEEQGNCKEWLQRLANRNRCAVLAFIAPYAAVRVSPQEVAHASIGLSEEFAIITAIEKIQMSKVKDLYILINSPGGLVSSSYKIAKVLRATFSNIRAFVPHVAASGGALMVLAANDVVMGPMSHLTPIDVQVSYNGQYVSAYSMNRALSRLSTFFEKITPEEAPYPWRAMTERLDPVLLEDWNSHITEMARYATELMRLAGYKPEQILKVVDGLVRPMEPHGFVIERDRAARLGIRTKLVNTSADHKILKLMKAWLTGYMLTESPKHIIRFVIPQGGTRDGGRNAKTKRTASKKR